MAYRDPSDPRRLERYKKYRAKPESKAKNAAYMRRRRAADSEFAEAQRKRCREWQKANRPYLNMKAREKRKKTPLERTIETALYEGVRARGGMCPKFVDAARRGAPDRLVILPDRPTFFVELKRPGLGIVKPWQQRYHDDLRAIGQRVWVLFTLEDVEDFFMEVDLT